MSSMYCTHLHAMLGMHHMHAPGGALQITIIIIVLKNIALIINIIITIIFLYIQ